MEKIKSFTLPKLPYDYKALAPYISEQQLKLHHDKHHQAYVNGANTIFEKLDKARSENADLDNKALSKRAVFPRWRSPFAHDFLGEHGASRQRRRKTRRSSR